MTQVPNKLALEIANWSHSRPIWEQSALGILARGELITDETLEELADLALREADGESVEHGKLKADDLWRFDGNDPVRLAAISEIAGVNALNWPDGVTFAPNGLTVVYGENGSGKSGYARILKKVTRSRHDAEILSNVFEEPVSQSAQLAVTAGSDEHILNWPLEQPDFLSRVSFYDSECASGYVSTETDVAYRPSMFTLFDNLVVIANRVREVLKERVEATSNTLSEIPTMRPGTTASEFCASVSATTTVEEIDSASELPVDADKRLTDLRLRIANLAVTNIPKRIEELTAVVSAVEDVRTGIAEVRRVLSDESIEQLLVAKSNAQTTRSAADAASVSQFAALPVDGVGTAEWRVLWDSARRFSEQVAYTDHHFPFVGDSTSRAFCPLCHQELDEDAVARFQSFDDYITADVERLAEEAEKELDKLASSLRDLEILDTDMELRLQRIADANEAARGELRSVLDDLETRREAVLAMINGDDGIQIRSLAQEAVPVEAQLLVAEVKGKLADLGSDGVEKQLQHLRDREAELVGRQALQDSRSAVEVHVAALKYRKTLEDAIRLTGTNGITLCAADLTRTHVGEDLKHSFDKEISALCFHNVKLEDVGGARGKLRHRAQLNSLVQQVRPDAILSEGEQTVLGLAGFLTEVESDETKSAVVFDDPVTSLDHVRREKMAERFVRLARERQVIVFTHDVALVTDLKRAAKVASVNIEERWVSKKQKYVGRVEESGPWDAKIAKERINELGRRIAGLRDKENHSNPNDWENEVRSWYQDLRITWERVLEEVLIGPVQKRGQLELRPSNTHVFAKFNETDHKELQKAFTRCGDMGSHDRSPELGRALATIEELEADLRILRDWRKRVDKYLHRSPK